MKKKLAAFIFLGIIPLFITSNTYSHGNELEYLEDKNGYRIDVGYGPVEMYANEPSNFDFRLLKDGRDTEYTDIWVRIIQDTQTIFATGIHNQDFGGSTLLYEFPKGGEYTVNIRYQNDGETLVESEFPVTIFPSEDEGIASDKKLIFIFGFLIALLFGVALGVIIGRTTKLLK